MTFHLHSTTRSAILHKKACINFDDLVVNAGQNMAVLEPIFVVMVERLFGKNYLCALAWSGLSWLCRWRRQLAATPGIEEAS